MARKRDPAWFASNDLSKWLGGLTRFVPKLTDRPATRRAFGLTGFALARLSGALPSDDVLGPHLARVLRETAAGLPADPDTVRLLKEDEGAASHSSALARLADLLQRLWLPDLGNVDWVGAILSLGSYVSEVPAESHEVGCVALRCLFQGIVRPAGFPPAWLTANSSAVVGLAQEVEANHRFDLLPVLGDALEDAGCADDVILRHCRSAEPHGWGCWVIAGILGEPEWTETRRYGVAVNCWSLHLYFNGDDQYALGERGFAFSKIGRYDDLLEDINSLLALNPGYAWAYQMRGHGHQQKRQYDLALADFNRAIELAPNVAWTHASLGHTYNNLGRFDEALASLGQAIQLDPWYGWARGKRGYAYQCKGEHARAIEEFTYALEHCPAYAADTDRPWALAQIGYAHNSLGQFDEALQWLGRAIELEPNNCWARAKRGYAYLNKGEYAQANEEFTYALEHCPDYAAHPDRAWALATRGHVHLLLGQPERAIEDLTRAIETPSFAKNSEWAWAHGRRAAAHLKRGDYQQARQDFEVVGHDAAGMNEFAWLLATYPDDAFRDGRRAVELATRACDLSSWKDANFIDTLAAAHAEAGDFSQAVRLQEQALALGPLEDEARRRLDLYRAGRPYRTP